MILADRQSRQARIAIGLSMSELNLPPSRSAGDHSSGVAYANISHQPLVGYWEFLALAMGALYASLRNGRD